MNLGLLLGVKRTHPIQALAQSIGEARRSAC
jgi:hypothetical protein